MLLTLKKMNCRKDEGQETMLRSFSLLLFSLFFFAGCQSMTWLPEGLYNIGCDQRIGVINNLKLSLDGDVDCGSPKQLQAAFECFRRYHCTDVVICGQVTAHALRSEFEELAKWYAAYFSTMASLEIRLSPADLKDGTAQRLWWNRYRVPWDKSVEEPYPVPQGITLPATGATGDVLILTRSSEKYEWFTVDI